MARPEEELAELERRYRKLALTLLLHAAFLLVCCGTVFVTRRALGLRPAVLGVIFIVALVVFGGDIFKFLTCRERLRRLRSTHHSP